MQNKLKGKVALVSGGSRGIGAAIAKRLALEGADVAISYMTSGDKAEAIVKEMKKNGVRAAAFKADQSNLAQAEELVKNVIKQFGHLDILVNNAGVFVGGAIDDPSVDISALQRQQAINVNGVVATVRTAVKHMGEGGRIILIGSCLGERVPYAAAADYSATKAALIGYAHGWARDLGKKNITVNVVQPGHIDTDMNPSSSEFAATMIKLVPLGRYGKAEEVASAVAFLASPEASYITGTALNVDGGINA